MEADELVEHPPKLEVDLASQVIRLEEVRP